METKSRASVWCVELFATRRRLQTIEVSLVGLPTKVGVWGRKAVRRRLRFGGAPKTPFSDPAQGPVDSPSDGVKLLVDEQKGAVGGSKHADKERVVIDLERVMINLALGKTWISRRSACSPPPTSRTS